MIAVFQSPETIHQLLLADGCEPILLYTSGSVGLLSGVKHPPPSGSLAPGDEIMWCRAAVLQEQTTVMYLAKTKVSCLSKIFFNNIIIESDKNVVLNEHNISLDILSHC